MTVHGNFSELTYTNGSGTAINAVNLNASQAVMKITDTELSRSLTFSWEQYKELFFYCSNKVINTFNDYSIWTDTGTLTRSEADYDECMIHGRGVKVLEPDNTAGELAIYDSGHPQQDLTEFESGDVAASGALICLLVYISDTTYITRISMRFGIDTSNYYYYDKTTGLVNGWNIITVPKSSFSTFGTPVDWTAIDYVAYRALFAANAQNEYIILNHCALVRPDSVTATLMNPFVANDHSGNWDVEIMTPSSQYLVYKDEQLEEICLTSCLQNGLSSSNPDFLGSGFVCSSFTASFRMVIKSTTYSQGLMWYVDDNNWILFQFDLGDAQITEMYGGSGSLHYSTPDASIKVGTTVIFRIEKVGGGTARLWVTDESETFTFVEVATETLNFADSDEGEVGIGAYSTSNLGTFQDFVMSNRRIDQLKLPELKINNIKKVQYVIKSADEGRATDTSYTDDSELLLRLRPFGTYRYKFNILTYGHTSGDFKARLGSTGDVDLGTYKAIRGIPNTESDPKNANVKTQASIPTNGDAYGTSTSDTTFVTIEGIVKTDGQGGFISLQWGQYSSHATATYVREDSTLIVEKIDDNY